MCAAVPSPLPPPPRDAASGGRAGVVIAGAGLAGLSLAARLAGGATLRDRLVLIDPRRDYRRDRTWCYWAFAEADDEPFVSHRWRRWRCVAPDGREVVRQADGVSYNLVAADDFYRDALARLRDAPHVELRLGEAVTRLDPGGRVVTPNGTWDAPLTFDARPRPPQAGRGDVTLLQQFVGRLVRLDRDLFDPSVVTLMDFNHPVAGPDDNGFVYLLPVGQREALVEATVMTPRVVPPETLDAAVLSYLDRRGVGRAEALAATVYEECGTLPMTTARYPPDPSPRVVRIGTAAGWAKPSTGYAFLATQRAMRDLADQINSGRRPVRPPRARSWRATFLDRVFLSYLHRHPRRAPLLFFRLFERAPPAALVRFLNDSASPLDTLRVIAAMPKVPFVAEALRSWRAWTKR